MWTSCVAINTQVWTDEGTIPSSVNIFCLKLVFHVLNSGTSKCFTPAKVLLCHQQTLISPALFLNILPLIQEEWSILTAAFNKWRQFTKIRWVSEDVLFCFYSVTFGIRVGKEKLCISAVKRQGLSEAPFKNILKIIARFFAKMIIYSTWTKLPAI